MKTNFTKIFTVVILMSVVLAACATATAVPQTPVIIKETAVPQTPVIIKETAVPQTPVVIKETAVPNPLITDTPVKISVRTYSWMSTGPSGLDGPQLRAWNAQYPNVTIDLQIVDDWTGQLNQDVAAGTAPDVLDYLGDAPRALIEAGDMMDLTPYFDYAALQKDYIPEYFNWMTFNNKLYSLWKDTDTRLVYYRSDLAKAAGINPQNGWTYADMRALAKKLTTPDMPGVCIGAENWIVLAMAVADGQAYGTDFSYNTDAVKGVFQFYSDLISDGSTPAAQSGLTHDQCAEMFAAGKVGMSLLQSQSMASVINSGSSTGLQPSQLGVVSLPVAKAGETPKSWGGGFAWMAVEKKQDDLTRAYIIDLLRYMTQMNNEIDYAMATDHLLPRYSYMDEINRLITTDASVKANPVSAFYPPWISVAKDNFTNDPENPNAKTWALGLNEGIAAIQAGQSVDAAVAASQTYYDANKK
jgi:ABC-type glycerol-3-phosphate transport system substrate-binding protein